ncbi:MAG TPA: hypothetical protein VFZ65_22565 [Planctomycetota bacterium]|nr:hypothetical protein [Planctomycetota bacterium]
MLTALLGLVLCSTTSAQQDPPRAQPRPAEAKPGDAKPADAKPTEYVPYPGHDVPAAFGVSAREQGGRRATIDGKKLTVMLESLESHARNYPPVFRDPDERKLAERDTAAASKLLATILRDKTKDAAPGLLLLAGRVEAVAHNLDLPGAAERADDYFGRILQKDPEHALANLRYGMHLAGRTGGQKDAVPLLEKAAKRGHDEALRGLGICWLILEDRPKALESLRAYAAKHPDDADTANLITAIESGDTEKVGTKPEPREKSGGAPPEKKG